MTHVGSTRLITPYVAALETELRWRAGGLTGPLETVYLGGGTPSMLSGNAVRQIVDGAARALGLHRRAEITMEAHPGTVTAHSLARYREAGVNRLSLGAESLDDKVLPGIGRKHSAAEVARAVAVARAADFDNVSLDLMYGLPGQSLRSWSETLERLLDLEPDHVSLYPLSIEPGTVFFRRQDQLALPEDDGVVEMYGLACRTLQHAGFEHYEVANWARPGLRSRHNMAYWLDRPFVAIGVGAHGYLRDARYENMRGVKRYIEAVDAGHDVTASRDVVDAATRLDEWVMLRLRLLQEGIDVRELRELYGAVIAAKVRDLALRFTAQIVVDGERLRLREEAVPIANEVWAGFMGLLEQPGARPLDLVS